MSGTERCSTAIFQKYSVKVIRLAEGAQELDTEDCMLYVPPGTFVGRDVATNTRESRFRKIAQRTSKARQPMSGVPARSDTVSRIRYDRKVPTGSQPSRLIYPIGGVALGSPQPIRAS